jgi:hypothetical protein
MKVLLNLITFIYDQFIILGFIIVVSTFGAFAYCQTNWQREHPKPTPLYYHYQIIQDKLTGQKGRIVNIQCNFGDEFCKYCIDSGFQSPKWVWENTIEAIR